MSDEIDNALQPDNLNSKKDKLNTEQRLKSLKELLNSDDVQFKPDQYKVKDGDFPATQNIQYIDYEQKDKEHRSYAEGIISGFIMNYVKSEELLNSVKLNNVKNQHIDKLANLKLLVDNTKRNLIMIQEAIDGGDMSVEMFKLSIDQTKELGSRIEAMGKHIESCENYWEKYAANYGLENKEAQIIQSKEISSEDNKNNTMIIDPNQLNKVIEQKIAEAEKKKEDLKKKNN